MSVQSGQFPEALKRSWLLPLYKGKGDRDAPGNYRPIALVGYLSKVLERVAKSQTESFLEGLGFFTRDQFGFRKSRSTDLALGHLWQEIADATENAEICLGAFLDVAKAFDCIDHQIFLEMLRTLGCSSSTVRWFGTYLSGREQAVKIGSLESRWEGVSIGTPQGSVLGPFIFIVYKNFIELGYQRLGLDRCRQIVYADDTTLLFRVSPDTLNESLEAALDGVRLAVGLFSRLGLVVNSTKTSLVLFRTSQRGLQVTSVPFCDQDYPLSPQATCLGVVFDENLKWDAHLDHLRKKCNAVIASLRRLRSTRMPQHDLLKVYRALFEPVLGCCLSVWGGGYEKVMHSVQVLQNDALRAITGRRRWDSVKDLYASFNVLPVDELCNLQRVTMGFKMLRGRVPADIVFPLPYVDYQRTRQANDLKIPYVRLETSRQALAHSIPVAWNSLPREIQSLSSVAAFTTEVKSHLMSKSRP